MKSNPLQDNEMIFEYLQLQKRSNVSSSRKETQNPPYAYPKGSFKNFTMKGFDTVFEPAPKSMDKIIHVHILPCTTDEFEMIFAVCRLKELKIYGIDKLSQQGLVHIQTYEIGEYKPPNQLEDQFEKIEKEIVISESLLAIDSSVVKEKEDKVILATGGVGTHIYLIDPIAGAHFGTLQGHMNSVMDLKFSPERPYWLLSASTDQAVLLWNTQTKQQLAHFHEMDYKNHYSAFTALAWYEDNFAVGNADGRIHLWAIPFTIDNLYTKQIKEFEKKNKQFDPGMIIQSTPPVSVSQIHNAPIDWVEFVSGELVVSKQIKGKIHISRLVKVAMMNMEQQIQLRVVREINITDKNQMLSFVPAVMSFQPGYIGVPLRKGMIELYHIQFQGNVNIQLKAGAEGQDLVGLDMKEVKPSGKYIVVVDEFAKVKVWKTEDPSR